MVETKSPYGTPRGSLQDLEVTMSKVYQAIKDLDTQTLSKADLFSAVAPILLHLNKKKRHLSSETKIVTGTESKLSFAPPNAQVAEVSLLDSDLHYRYNITSEYKRINQGATFILESKDEIQKFLVKAVSSTNCKLLIDYFTFE